MLSMRVTSTRSVRTSDATALLPEVLDLIERNDLIVCNEPAQMSRHVVHKGHTELIDYFVVSRRTVALNSDVYVGEDVESDHLPAHLLLQLRCNIDKVSVRQVRILSK